MQIADANYLLRYILNDVEEQANETKTVLDSSTVSIPVEVIAEVVYVLSGVYQVPRDEIAAKLKDLIDGITPDIRDVDSVIVALDYFADTKLDFVDCLLAAYSTVNDATILTFDQKLLRFISRQQTEG
jgi:predicted nucleic-acid-binding protein